ncbi:unnamed protein product [Chondrus crispus]|uniref:Uncharacterized protein n=1 Tax=Chondrus crispus TaxID=2769 RepID=R7Q8U5_CHOCR|nr:unnamed protein product [Chondrus crispus]CDF34942.1 unnamed protein product [Chondrus crispus]|eukprot:XP_005714761.1 unnamed protein product [Chondrus crispus]
MSSVKAKLAALRAKRAKQRSAATPLADPELSAAALAVGAPQVSWDADYKAKLRQVDTTSTLKDSEGSFCLSGEDDDELVVLPPPTRKLNPAAQRQLWRRRELERAKEKAAKTLLEIRPESFDVDDVPMEPCSEDPGTLEDGKVDEREEGGNLSDRDEDEDEVPPNRPGSGYLGAENGVEQDEEEAALKTAQLEEEEEYEDAMDDLPLATPEDVLENNTPCVVTNKCDAPENGARASEQAEQDASRHATEAKETTNDTASTEDQVAPEAPQETNQSTMEATSDTRQINVPGEKKLRKGSWFIGWKKSPEVKAPERRFKTGFVEEEAHDDDGDGQDDCGGGAASNDDADNDEDEYDELAEKENINPSENKKLSAFHQKWILDKEKGELEAMKTVPGRMMVNVVDEAMDLTELRSKPDTETKKEEPLEEEEHLSEADVGTCEVGGVPEKIQHGSGDYVDAMYVSARRMHL